MRILVLILALVGVVRLAFGQERASVEQSIAEARQMPPDRAHVHLDNALESARTAKDRVGEIQILRTLAELEWRTEKRVRSFACLELAERLAANIPNLPLQVDVLEDLAWCYRTDQKLDLSRETRLKAVEVAKKSRDDFRIMQQQLHLGVELFQTGYIAQARPLLVNAIEQARAAKNEEFECDASTWLTYVYHGLRNREKMELHAARALELAEKRKNIDAFMVTSLAIAVDDLSRGRFPEAAARYQALADRARLEAPAYLSDCLSGLGDALAIPGDYGKGLQLLREAAAIAAKDGIEHSEGRIMARLADIYQFLNQNMKAIDCGKRAVRLLAKSGDTPGQADALYHLGLANLHMGWLHSARDYCKKALELQKRSPRYDTLAYEHLVLGKIDFIQGKTDPAKKHFLTAVAAVHNTDSRVIEGLSFLSLSAVAVQEHRLPEALRLAKRATLLAHMQENADFLIEALRSYAYTLKLSGRGTAAIAIGKRALNLNQKGRASLAGAGAETLQSYTDSVASRYRMVASWLSDEGRLSEAQQVLDLLKDREYFKYLDERSGASEGVDLTASEKVWSEQFDKLDAEIGRLSVEYRELAALPAEEITEAQKLRRKDLRSKLQAASAAFNSFLEAASATFAESKSSSGRFDDLRGAQALNRALARLPGKPAAVYTLVTQDGVRTILTLPNVSLVRKAKGLTSASALNKKIVQFRQAVQDPRIDPRPLGAELYDLLVRPIEADLSGAGVDVIMWSLDGALRYVPMWALYDARTSKFLIEKYPSSVFTPRTIDRLAEAPSAGTSAAAFGISEAATVNLRERVSFAALPSVRREMATLATLYHSKPFLDSAFTLDALQEELYAKPSVLHLATHFRFKPANDEDSFLLLGKEQVLTVAAFKRMPEGLLNNVDLLVLSACETAMGESADGSEFESFALLAQLKGAGAVLATLWTVADDSTAELMRLFYQGRKDHPEWSKLACLREAQLAMLRGTTGGETGGDRTRSEFAGAKPTGVVTWPSGLPRYAHPYYWAPFVMIGNWK